MSTHAEMRAEATDGFFLAAEHGRSDVLKALADHAQGQLDLREIVDPKTGRTPLHVAVANGKTDAVRVLLAAGFPPDHESFAAGNSSSSSGRNSGVSASNAADASSTPATSDGPLRKRQHTAYLLAKQLGATDLVFVFHQFTIQQIATNNVDGVRQMLAAGVDADMTDGSAQNTFLHWAVTCSAMEVLAFLLQCEDVQQQNVVDRLNAEGATPLHLACKANHVECTRLLLRHHADPSVKGKGGGVYKGKTAMEVATSKDVKELFDSEKQQKHRRDASGNSSPPSSSDATSTTSGSVDDEHVADTKADRRNSGSQQRVSGQDVRDSKLMVQLEEKDLLIVQLRRTIEVLVVESQEIRKLGDERVVLDYVRKLRDENAVLQRNLEDAEDHIRIQQEQLQQLKSEIRKMAAGKQEPTLSDDRGDSQTPSDETYPGLPSGSGTHGNGLSTIGESRLPASPLRLDSSSSAADRPAHIWGEKPPGSNRGEAWGGKVLGGLWPFGAASEEAQEIDGEVIMTV